MVDDRHDRDDGRDDELARALAVAPLDELTRRRLVARALEESPDVPAPDVRGARRGRFAAVAAAAAFVVLGVVALALPGGDTAEVAGRAPQSRADRAAAAPEAAGAPTTPSSAPDDARATTGGGSLATEGTSADVAVQDSGSSNTPVGKEPPALPHLGNLGDLSAAGAADRVVTVAAPLTDGVAPQRWTFTFQQCPERTLTVVATGLGELDRHPVQVYVSRRPDSTLRVRALDGTTCTLRSLP